MSERVASVVWLCLLGAGIAAAALGSLVACEWCLGCASGFALRGSLDSHAAKGKAITEAKSA